MLSAEINELVTRTGPASPCGLMMRNYWQPVALSDELQTNRPVRPLKVLGERLVLYRGQDGELGLIGRHCPHRGADLAYGRLEGGGLRCPFHGWLFDAAGRCLEMPAEPETSRMHEQIQQCAYPVTEKNGIVFAYMGSGQPPALPGYDSLVAPDEFTFAFKGLIECNWLQALEVGIDPAHASFLHRFLRDGDPAEGYGQQFRDSAANSDIPVTQILREFPRPEIEVEETGFGLRIAALRALPEHGMHVRITNLAFPHAIVIPMSKDMTITQWHVPVDDTSCYWYAIFTDYARAVDQQDMRAQRLKLYELPDYRPRKNKSNGYGYDPAEQRSETYTGMGLDINVHDQWAVESPGPVFDRTQEHLATSDKAIVAYRRLLRSAIKAAETGSPLPATDCPDVLRGPAAIDTLAPAASWADAWRAGERARRETSPWAADLS